MTMTHEEALQLQELFRRKRRLEEFIANSDDSEAKTRAEMELAAILPMVSFQGSEEPWTELRQAEYDYRVAMVREALGPDRDLVGFAPPRRPHEKDSTYISRVRGMAAKRSPGRPADEDRKFQILLMVTDRMEQYGEDQKTAARRVSRDFNGKPSAARIEQLCATLRQQMGRELAEVFGDSLLQVLSVEAEDV